MFFFNYYRYIKLKGNNAFHNHHHKMNFKPLMDHLVQEEQTLKCFHGALNKAFVNVPSIYMHPAFSLHGLAECARAAEEYRSLYNRIFKTTPPAHWFLTPSLTRDLDNTDLPEHFLDSDITEIVPTGIIHLPSVMSVKNCNEEEETIASIFFSFVSHENMYYLYYNVLSCFFPKQKQAQFLNRAKVVFPSPTTPHLFQIGLNCSLKALVERQITVEKEMNNNDELTKRALYFLLNLFIYMKSVPTDQPESVIRNRRESVVRPDNKLVLWKPNIIGLHHEKQAKSRNDLGGVHASPRTHWRRGHWRRSKTITGYKQNWILPVLVNAPLKE